MGKLKMCKCKYCRRHAELTSRKGGWTVDCYYSDKMNAVIDRVRWCEQAHNDDNSGKLFDSPNEAIKAWNESNCEKGEE